MGIYIRDMEMPTDNTVLIRVFPASENGECYVQQLDVDGDILTELWAVPVPPHGRLIDAEALEDRCSRQAKDEWNKSTGTNWGYAYATFESDVEDAPTIIPAEEG